MDCHGTSCSRTAGSVSRTFGGKVGREEVFVTGEDVRFIFRQIGNDIVGQLQRILDDLRRRQAEPLRYRDICHGAKGSAWIDRSSAASTLRIRTAVVRRLQNFQVDHVHVPRVLDVVAVREGDISHVTFCEIERPRGRGGGEDADAGLAGDEEVPLVAGGVPVDLAHGARLDRDKGGTEVVRDGESGRVDDFDRAARDHVRLLLREMIGVRYVPGDTTVRAGDVLSGEVARGRGTGEDVQLLLGGVVERGDVSPEVFGHDRLWSPHEELRGEEGVLFRKGAGVEDEQELGTLSKRLDGVRESGGKEPYISRIEVVISGLTVIVHDADPGASVEDVGPLISLMPVEFAVSVRRQFHIDAGHLSCCGHLVDILLTCEPGLIQSGAVIAQS